MQNENEKHQLEWCDFKSEIIAAPKVSLKRFDDGKSNRFYYWGEGENINIGIGITSLLSQVIPESSFLTDWKLKYGDNWKKVLNEAAEYGTLMHAIYNEWLIKNEVPEEMMQKAREMCSRTGKSANMIDKDLLAFIKFTEDYKVKPLVLEGLLRSESVNGQHYALAIDCLCSMTIQDKTKTTVEDGEYVRGEKKGEKKYKEVTEVKEKNIIAVIDFKSNSFEKESKSFYESHLYQLIAAKKAVLHNFNLEVDAMFNFAPNAWRTEPTYSLKEWKPTDNDYALFDAYINLACLKGVMSPKGSIFVPPAFNKNTKSSDYRIISYRDFIQNEQTS